MKLDLPFNVPGPHAALDKIRKCPVTLRILDCPEKKKRREKKVRSATTGPNFAWQQ